jgi:hypothetical protein
MFPTSFCLKRGGSNSAEARAISGHITQIIELGDGYALVALWAARHASQATATTPTVGTLAMAWLCQTRNGCHNRQTQGTRGTVEERLRCAITA